jgi:hypothetical protein
MRSREAAVEGSDSGGKGESAERGVMSSITRCPGRCLDFSSSGRIGVKVEAGVLRVFVIPL